MFSGTLRILEYCARPTPHALQQELLNNAWKNQEVDWRQLLALAEKHGMVPLLAFHLEEAGISVPRGMQRSLTLMLDTQRRLHSIRQNLLARIDVLLAESSIDFAVLKGAAVCLQVYPEPWLRPMGDMDLFLTREDACRAHRFLLENGWEMTSPPLAGEYHHLQPLSYTIDQHTVFLELHHGLYPDYPPGYPKISGEEYLRQTVCPDGMSLRTLDHTSTLQHLFLHGLRQPLSFAPPKLIHVADVTGFYEKFHNFIDHDRLNRETPYLLRALPLLHHIVPWDTDKLPDGFPLPSKKKMSPGFFSGWPMCRMQQISGTGSLGRLVIASLFPPRWWTALYYGAGESHLRLLFARLWQHPRHLFWWASHLSHFLFEMPPGTKGISGCFTRLSVWMKRVRVLMKKINTITVRDSSDRNVPG